MKAIYLSGAQYKELETMIGEHEETLGVVVRSCYAAGKKRGVGIGIAVTIGTIIVGNKIAKKLAEKIEVEVEVE